MVHRALIPGQRTRALTALVPCALILCLALALPVSAAGPLKLTAGSGDPATDTAGSTFSFSVTYISKDDEPPAFVRVILEGVAHDLVPVDSSDSVMRDGARYRIRLKLKSPGTYDYSFVALDSKGREASLAGGTVTVTRKSRPTPKPTPKPTQKPGSGSTGASGGGRSSSGDESPSSATDEPADELIAGFLLDYDGGPGSDRWGTGGSDVLESNDGLGWPDDGLGWPAAGRGLGEPDAGGPAIGDDRPGDPVAPAIGIGPLAPSAIAALAAILPGVGSDQWLALASRSAIIAAGSAALVAMALFTFRRRRREDEDPLDKPRRDEAPTAPPSPTTGQPAPMGEMAMPRWRRPSLNQARKADPGTSLAAIEAERLTFTGDVETGDVANERRRVRYRMVRLSDSPDEILGQEIGRLDEGDEVELLERSGLYWKVRTPPGQIGWVHKMTLGDVVSGVDPQGSVQDAEAEGDVQAAFDEAQARRGFQPVAEPVLGEGLAARFIRERGAG